MFWNKKEEEPKKSESKKDALKKDLLQKCNINTASIILKIAKKREEVYHLGKVPKDLFKEVDTRFENMVLYMKKVNWESNIDQALSNACLQDIDGVFQSDFSDPDTVKFLLNLTWQDIQKDMNEMINNVNLLIIKEKETKGK